VALKTSVRSTFLFALRRSRHVAVSKVLSGHLASTHAAAAKRRLTPRSSRPATAGSVSLVRGTWCIIAYQAYAARLRGRLSSNVRPHRNNPLVRAAPRELQYEGTRSVEYLDQSQSPGIATVAASPSEVVGRVRVGRGSQRSPTTWRRQVSAPDPARFGNHVNKEHARCPSEHSACALCEHQSGAADSRSTARPRFPSSRFAHVRAPSGACTAKFRSRCLTQQNAGHGRCGLTPRSTGPATAGSVRLA
jgi:hypothetical protein